MITSEGVKLKIMGEIMKKCLIGIFMLTVSSWSFAAGWTIPLTVEKVFTEGSTDLIVIYTSGGTLNTPGCLTNNWIFEATTEDRRNRAYSTAMTALASGKKLSLWFDDTCSAWSYHKATSIQLHK